MESGSLIVQLHMSKSIIAIIFLVLLFHCANCSRYDYDIITAYDRVRAEMRKNYDDIQPAGLARNYSILNLSNLFVNKGDKLEVKIGKLFSRKTKQHESYYSLPFCRPNNNTVDSAAEFESSPYVFKMLEPQLCNVVCRVALDSVSLSNLRKKMEDKYNINMILNGLPLVKQRSDVYQLGYPIGRVIIFGMKLPKMYTINNHLVFTVKYHKDLQTDSMRIVEFSVQPHSYDYDYEGKRDEKVNPTACNSDSKSWPWQEVSYWKEIIFTYDVLFEEVLDPVAHHSSR